MRNLAKADALRGRAETAGVDVEIVQLDVNDEASVASAVAGVIERHGTVDVLVDNAGVASRGAVDTMSRESAHRSMDTNFWGPIRCSRAALPAMRAQRSGAIVDVSSLSGRLPGTPYTSMYSASKSAINAVSEALATEVEPFGRRCRHVPRPARPSGRIRRLDGRGHASHRSRRRTPPGQPVAQRATLTL